MHPASLKIFRTMMRFDARLMVRANGWRAPRWIRFLVLSATRCGDGWLWYALGLILLRWGGTQRFSAVGSGLLSVGIGTVIFKLLKHTLRRPRPCQIAAHVWSHIRPPDRFSFPSGHAITACAIAATIGGFYPHLAPALWLSAAAIAASRVLTGMHFASDVLAGSLIGASVGLMCYHLFL